jgi:hypothetical protein
VEVGVEDLAERLQRLALQDDKAPEDEDVQQPRPAPLQDLGLGQDVFDLVGQLLAPVAHALRHALAA